MRPLAMVIGASQRVGRAAALELARAGFDLVVSWRSDRAGAEETAAMAAARGAAATVTHLDLEDAPAAAAAASRAAPQRLDALVLSAAQWERDLDGSRGGDAQARRLMTVNAEAPIAVIRAMAPLLSRSSLAGGAAVTAFGDIHAVGVPIAGYGGYLASKAAMQRGLRALALELAPRIRVNVIVAGLIARPPTMRDDELRDYLSRVPLARAGTPGDAAALVRFLTLEAPFMTGCAVTLDGGRSLHWPEPAAG